MNPKFLFERNSVIRKDIALEFITLDGVIKARGGPEEDTGGDFTYGWWVIPYSDEVIGSIIKRQMNMPFDLLLGRKTFEIWAPYWPLYADVWPGVMTAKKYVASNTISSHEWQPTVFLSGDIAKKVAGLRQLPGPDLNIYGSANLLQRLFGNDLVDELWLKIYPATLSRGKRLLADGVIIVNYARAGEVQTGSF